MTDAEPVCNLCGQRKADLLIEKDGYRILRCQTCELVFVGNPPGEAALLQHYSFEAGYHQELAENARAVALHTAEAASNLDSLRRFRSGGTLLDVGCSTGLFLAAARNAGWSVKGVEYSPDTAELARREHGLDVLTGTLEADTLGGERFDVVTLWDVLEHVPDPKTVLANARHRLGASSLLLIKTPNVDGWFPSLSLRLARRLDFWRHPEPPGHLFQFSVKTLAGLLGATGYEIVAVRHGRIPIVYSFGPPRTWLRSLKWALYCACFMPWAWLGSYFGAGDDMLVVARLRKDGVA